MATQAQWMNIDVDTLSDEAQVAYAEYKDAQRKAAALRATFEAVVTSNLDIPAGKRMVFGYRFGQLSAALVEDDRKAKQVKGSLAQFMAAQSADGYEC